MVKVSITLPNGVLVTVEGEEAEVTERVTRLLHDLPNVVRVENDRIVADPAKMIRGLGYPVTYKSRRWWVENVDGDLIRYYRGPKV